MAEKKGAYRDRSVAIVVRNGKILMERVCYSGRTFYTIPGGGIEDGETPEQTVIRELKEECNVDGTIIKSLAVQHDHGRIEHSFEVSIPDDQEPSLGYDPEENPDNPPLQAVMWRDLSEISEKDRAFLWAYGLIYVADFFKTISAWGDEVSFPKGEK